VKASGFSMQLSVSPTAAVRGGAYQTHIQSLAAAIKPRILVRARGSGNFGESGASAFYTINELPEPLHALDLSWPPQPLARTDIDLGPGRLAFYIDDVLSPLQADALAACAESVLDANGHSRVAPGINTPPGMRINEAAHWYPSYAAAPQFLGGIFERIRHLVPQELGGLPLYAGLSQKVAQFKYSDGDRFERHVDGLFAGQGANETGDGIDEWNGVQSGMSILLYCNDGESDGLDGGETRLWNADGDRHVDITPRKGRALFFRRGSVDAVLHAGLPVRGVVPKYMALINLAYGERVGVRPMMV
jgi:hypothetical protein